MNYTEEYQPGMWSGYPLWGAYGDIIGLNLGLVYLGTQEEAEQAL